MQNNKFQNQPHRKITTTLLNHSDTSPTPAKHRNTAGRRKRISFGRCVALVSAILLVLAICGTTAGLFYSMLTFSDAPADSGADSAVLPPSEQANRPTEEPAEKPEILTRENGSAYRSYTDDAYRITAFYPETGNTETDRLIQEKIDALVSESGQTVRTAAEAIPLC